MNRKEFMLASALASLFVCGAGPAVLAGEVNGFDCVVDLPDTLVARNPTGLSSDTVDKTSKITTTSKMECDAKGEVELVCKARLSKDEVVAMGGKSKSIYTYNNITKCSLDRSICASGSKGLVTTRKSQLVIKQTDDFTARGANPDTKWVASVKCDSL